MAITTDTGAKKIENSENWRNIFGIHNDSVDAYDALAEQKDEEIGIVVKGNKTAHTGGAAAGQYIILRNSTITGCDDGLYTAAQAIPYDTAIDSTYLTPVSGGGLNALKASLTNYSTTEKPIGKWIDGSPIYQKSYYYNGSAKTANFVIDSVLNISYCALLKCTGSLREGNYWYNMPYTASNASLTFVQENNVGLSCRMVGGWSIAEYCITAEYIKRSS